MTVNQRPFRLICFFSLALLGLGACSLSPPPLPDNPWHDIGDGGLVYFKAQFPEARPVIDAALQTGSFDLFGLQLSDQSGQLNQAIDRCDLLLGAFWPEGLAQRWRVKALGQFPVFWANLSLALNCQWHRQSSAVGGYWSSIDGLGLVFLASSAVLVSDALPFAPKTGPLMPDIYKPDYDKAAVWLWFPEANLIIGQLTDSLLPGIRMPVKEFRLGIDRLDDDWEAKLIFRFSASREAVAFASLIKLARLAWRPQNFNSEDLKAVTNLAEAWLFSEISVFGEELIFQLKPQTTESLVELLSAIGALLA